MRLSAAAARLEVLIVKLLVAPVAPLKVFALVFLLSVTKLNVPDELILVNVVSPTIRVLSPDEATNVFELPATVSEAPVALNFTVADSAEVSADAVMVPLMALKVLRVVAE